MAATAPASATTATMLPDSMRLYRSRRDSAHVPFSSKYAILGFISSGTYGRVYKAQSRDKRIYAIKKFKPDKEGDVVTYVGLSQSAIREIAINKEIEHEHVVRLAEVILEAKSIYMVFEYAEHDFLQVIHHHTQTLRTQISMQLLKSLIYQLLKGLVYLHSTHVLHRDLKPANILITASGSVKIGDLGLARLTYEPLVSLTSGDKVVVTIWYRAPELLLGTKHYTTAIDCWAVGCVLAELAALRPIFKGEEAKPDAKKAVPFQKDQLIRITEVLGTPQEHEWPDLMHMPEYGAFRRLERFSPALASWCSQRIRTRDGVDILSRFFAYDPNKRATAREALNHRWFTEEPKPTVNVFQTIPSNQLPPQRRITQDETPSMSMHGMQAGPAAPPHNPNTLPIGSGKPNSAGPTVNTGPNMGNSSRKRAKIA